ncbi:unnamed protein product [Soboliphyme baturini]|uniref:Ovule protein n=1 Tax=Soboliphyme baturini TaxID=241478 RepID=A0A183IH32_9BILA|nr:unnamed protein product [Soboliphyme baturini]
MLRRTVLMIKRSKTWHAIKCGKTTESHNSLTYLTYRTIAVTHNSQRPVYIVPPKGLPKVNLAAFLVGYLTDSTYSKKVSLVLYEVLCAAT